MRINRRAIFAFLSATPILGSGYLLHKYFRTRELGAFADPEFTIVIDSLYESRLKSVPLGGHFHYKRLYLLTPLNMTSEFLHHLIIISPVASSIKLMAQSSEPVMKLKMSHESLFDVEYDFGRDFLCKDSNGAISFSPFRNNHSEAHRYQSLATWSLCHIPVDTLVHGQELDISIARLFENSISNIWQMDDIEWLLITLSLSFSNQKVVRISQKPIDIEKMCQNLMDGYSVGTCFHTHDLFALALVFATNHISHLVGTESASRIKSFLDKMVLQLIESQRLPGYWTPDWQNSLADRSEHTLDINFYTKARLVQATSHHLDWLLIYPTDPTLGTSFLETAFRWLCQAVESVDDSEYRNNFCAYSHGVKVIAIVDRLNPKENSK